MANAEVINLDISIDENNLKPGILKVLEKVRPQWKQSDIKQKIFTDGITNKLVGCYHGAFDDVVIIRIYGPKTELLIDRAAEKKNMIILHSMGMAKPLYCAFNNGVAYGFVHGEMLDETSVRDKHISRLVAKEMVRMHSIKYSDICGNNSAEPESFFFKSARKILKLRPDKFEDPERNKRLQTELPSLDQLDAEISLMENTVIGFNTSIVFSHNDILLKNIVHNKDDDRTYFIDYEYGGLNYLGYDIGNHFCEWAGIEVVDFNNCPNKEVQLPWLRAYLEHKNNIEGRPDEDIPPERLETFYEQVQVFMLCSHLFWGMWGLVQAANSTIDFDFLDYAILRLNQYAKEKKTCVVLNRT